MATKCLRSSYPFYTVSYYTYLLLGRTVNVGLQCRDKPLLVCIGTSTRLTLFMIVWCNNSILCYYSIYYILFIICTRRMCSRSSDSFYIV